MMQNEANKMSQHIDNDSLKSGGGDPLPDNGLSNNRTAACAEAHDQCDEGGTVVVVDDDGVPIDPAAEGSFMMAEGLSLLLMAQHGEAEDSQGGLVLEPYVPDFDVAEAKAKSKAFFKSLGGDCSPVSGDAAVAGPPTSDDRCPGELEENDDYDYYSDEQEDGRHDGEEEEEEDDFPAMGSRDMTDPDDWVLEAILKRRMNKEAPAGGPWVYWCKWKGHEEPTWETREVMEEAGWIPQLDAYDARGVHTKKRRPAMVIPSSTECRKLIESYFGVDDAAVAKVIMAKGAPVHHYTRVNEALAAKFYERWVAKKATHVPQLVFHGTRSANLSSISRMGLVVGGTRGVPVANGAAYGSGVYTATSPATPIFHAGGSSTLIACVGLVPVSVRRQSQDVFRICSDYVIFRCADDVYPMWFVQTAGVDDLLPPAPTLVDRTWFLRHAHSGFGLYPLPHSNNVSVPPNKNLLGRMFDDGATSLTESETRAVNKALKEHLTTSGGGTNNKGFSKAALKAQPRRIKELLTTMMAENGGSRK